VRLYSRTDAASVDADGQHYEPGDDGGIDFPDALSGKLRTFAHAGIRLWEDQDERRRRLIAEELERRQRPGAAADAFDQAVLAIAEQTAVAADQAAQALAPDPAG
jgi:hypothetical protein